MSAKTLPSSKDDVELTTLLTKLYSMQEDVGAKDKTSDEDKLKKAATISMGRGRAAKKSGGRFLELKSSIIERLRSVGTMLKEENERGRTPVARGNNPRTVIAAQQELREQIRAMEEEWGELDGLYKTEAKKRRSRFTQEELEVQATMVTQLKTKIESCKQAQTKGYGRGGDVAAQLNTRALTEMDASPMYGNSNNNNSWGNNNNNSGAPGAALTEGQEMQLQQLQERDADFDQQLDVIGDGLQDLAELADMQGEEVRRQNQMLDGLNKRIDGVNTHVTNVNDKMKETLTEVRAADKICVDIMCILMAIGFAAVIYNVIKSM